MLNISLLVDSLPFFSVFFFSDVLVYLPTGYAVDVHLDSVYTILQPMAPVSDFRFVLHVFTVDDIAVIWINGTNSIMTDGYASTTDPRIKPGPSQEPKSGDKFVEHTLVIEQVTRFDSGTYTCRVMSEPPVQITHTLGVTRQYIIFILYAFYCPPHTHAHTGVICRVVEGPGPSGGVGCGVKTSNFDFRFSIFFVSVFFFLSFKAWGGGRRVVQ